MALTLEQLNAADTATAVQLLDGLYEHSPWIVERALAQRPFRSLAHLKHAMVQVLARVEAKLALQRTGTLYCTNLQSPAAAWLEVLHEQLHALARWQPGAWMRPAQQWPCLLQCP